MTGNETQREDLLDRLVLDIKAMTLLYGSESDLKDDLQARIAGSQDEGVQEFVKALQVKRPSHGGRLLAIALGELVMASILVVAGAVVLVPTAIGLNTIGSLAQYYASRVTGNLGGSPLSPYISFVEFAIGVLLVLSAFFALREAASNLKEAGFTVRSGES
jgi:hypothetical protein